MRRRAVVFLALIAAAAVAQDRTVRPRALSTAATNRHALVIGNKDYVRQPLLNPVNDATDLAGSLRASGFTVTLKTNLRREEMDAALAAYSVTLSAGDSALVYFSGHGLELQGQNYLLPVDFAADAEYQVRSRALNSADILDALKARGVAVTILILDACRNNPYRAWARAQGSGGLAPLQADGAYIAFAAAPGQIASDNRGGRNGLFTKHLKEAIAQQGLSINDVFDQVRERVLHESGSGQRPFSTTGLVGRFYFRESGAAAAAAPAPESAPLLQIDVATEAWKEVKDSASAGLLEGYVKEFPDSRYTGLARIRLAAMRERATQAEARPDEFLSNKPNVERGQPANLSWKINGSEPLRLEPGIGAIAPTGSRLVYPNETTTYTISAGGKTRLSVRITVTEPNSGAEAVGKSRVNPKDGLTYVYVPPGKFLMGCSVGDTECYPDERPTKVVTIAQGFYLTESEVTHGAYGRVAGLSPSRLVWVDRPVGMVDWNTAASYCEQIGGRLPTAAEWEYAARGGTVASRYGDLASTAWYRESSGSMRKVKEKAPNKLGLYDMLGSQWEWTSTGYDGTTKELRGGSSSDYPGLVRVSSRRRNSPSYAHDSIGFRCAWE